MMTMLNIVSVLIGLTALFFLIPAFLPLLGALNWLVVPLAIVGLAIGAMSRGRAGRNLNLVVIAIGVLRLMLGGGLI